MRFVRTFAFFFLLFGYLQPSVGEAPPASQSPPVASPTSPQEPADRRINALEDQFSIVREYNDDFLSIVIWSLSTVSALAVVLIGFNWFQSSRALKKEFEVLRGQLIASISEKSAESSNKLEARLTEVQKDLKKLAGAAAEESAIKLRSQLGTLRGLVLNLRFKSIEAEVKMWLARPVPINAVMTCGELIDCAVELGIEWRTNAALELLTDSLDLLKKEGGRMDLQILSELEASVERIPANHKTARAAILARLSDLHRGK